MTLDKTALNDEHKKLNAHMVPFAGWDMPLHYGSQIQEHMVVRERVGMFDVSHMRVVDVIGADACAFLRYIAANDVVKLSDNNALYTCLLNAQGGVVDDCIIYKISDDNYRMIVNAATAETDFSWLQQHACHHSVKLHLREKLAIIAVQGPSSKRVMAEIYSTAAIPSLARFSAIGCSDHFIARTGYTGENGYEIILPESQAIDLWNTLLSHEVVPCGFGSRDSLRLEAGYNLYGQDMDESTSPLESQLAWTIDWKDASRDFIGKSALLKQKQQGTFQKMVGLVLQGKGVLRQGQSVVCQSAEGIGTITSGGFSPILQCGIALARVPKSFSTDLYVERRGQQMQVLIKKPPFISK